jgi:radical SAM superfamily enzyme
MYIAKNIKNVRYIFFLDGSINSDKVRMIKLCDIISEENINRTKIIFEIYPDILDKEMIDSINKINVGQLQCGVQTTNQKVLSIIHRIYSPKNFSRNIKSFQKKNIKIIIDLIVGLPEDNLLSLKESLKEIINLKTGIVQCIPLYLLPGTEIYGLRDKYHYLFDENVMNRVISSDTWSEGDVEMGRKLGDLIFKTTKKRWLLKSLFNISCWPYVFNNFVFNFDQYYFKEGLLQLFYILSP